MANPHRQFRLRLGHACVVATGERESQLTALKQFNFSRRLTYFRNVGVGGSSPFCGTIAQFEGGFLRDRRFSALLVSA